MEEQWKDIFGYEGLYQISNYGRVKSLKYGKEEILKPIKDKKGYLHVHLRKDGMEKHHRIHRLVANAFIPNEDLFKTDINHKDENKENNVWSNLEWCDKTYNNNYGGRNKGIAISLSKQVQQYSKDGKTLIKTFQSTMEIQRQLGFANTHISECCLGKQKTAYNYVWKYKE